MKGWFAYCSQMIKKSTPVERSLAEMVRTVVIMIGVGLPRPIHLGIPLCAPFRSVEPRAGRYSRPMERAERSLTKTLDDPPDFSSCTTHRWGWGLGICRQVENRRGGIH